MRLPFELPYKCQEPGCRCAEAYPPGSGAYVRVRTRPGEAHEARIIEDGLVLDVFQDHDLSALLTAVHHEYPGAETHSPFHGKVARAAHGNKYDTGYEGLGGT